MPHEIIQAAELQAAMSGDEKATEIILNKMRPMRIDLVNKVFPRHLHDAGMSIAMEANWLALLSFDPAASSSKFTTHAYSQMRYALLTEVSTTSNGTTGLAHSVAHRYRKLLEATEGDVCAAAELADEAGSDFTAATFLAAHDAMSVSPSLDTEYDTFDYDARSVEETVIDTVQLERLMTELTTQQATIVKMAFGIGGSPEMTDGEIGEALGLPRLTIQRRRVAALATMKLAA